MLFFCFDSLEVTSLFLDYYIKPNIQEIKLIVTVTMLQNKRKEEEEEWEFGESKFILCGSNEVV